MGKEVLATDVDEVLFPLLEHFLVDYNTTHGTDVRREQFTTYDFDGPLGLSVPETVKRVYAFNGADHSHIDPIEGTQAAIDKLSSRFDMVVVTARHPEFETNTRKWLETKLGEFFHGLHMVGYAAIMEKPLTKARICEEIGAVALIDDSVGHVRQCGEAGIEGVLFGDYPWNQTAALPPNVTRCADWSAVVEHFGVGD